MFNLFTKNKFHKDLIVFQNDISLRYFDVYSRELLASASMAKSSGFSVEYIKYSQFDKNSDKDKVFILNMFSPKLFLFETDGFNLQNVLKASSFIRKEIPDSKIALICCEDIVQRLSSLNIFDFFILFDSDLVIVDILKNIETMTEKILNPICDSEEKTTFLNFDLVPVLPQTNYFSSRHADEIGNFAYKNKKPEVLYSPERVIFELKQLINAHVKQINISDFAFMKDEKRFEKICLSLSELKKTVEMPLISCFADIKILSEHQEYFELMKNAGIKVVNIVIGSSDSDSRKFYGLDFKNEDLEKVVKYASNCGDILLNGIFYVASPYDNEEKIKKSCVYALYLSNLYPLCFDVSVKSIYPKIGSIMYDFVKTEDFGFKDGFLYTDDPDFEFLSDFSSPIYFTSNMNLEKIQKCIEYFNNMIVENLKQQLISPDVNSIIFHNKLYEDYFYISYNYSILKNLFAYIYKYINLLEYPYFFKMDNVSREELLDSFPVKALSLDYYQPYKNTGYIFEQSPMPITITDDIEVSAFEYSLGKLKLKDIVKRIIADFPDKKLDDSDLIDNKLIPFYKKMEDNFIILFFR